MLEPNMSSSLRHVCECTEQHHNPENSPVSSQSFMLLGNPDYAYFMDYR